VLVCAAAMFTNLRAKFCLGLFEKPDHAPSPIFVFKNVEYDNSFPCAQIIQLFLQSTVHRAGSSVQIVAFSSILQGYINTATPYQQNQILSDPISSPALFSEKVTYLLPTTYWKIVYHPENDQFEIRRE